LKQNISIKSIELIPKLDNNSDILEDGAWNIRLVLSLKQFMKKLREKEGIEKELKTKKKIDYSAREYELMKYIEDNMDYEGCKISPEEVLEIINPDRASHCMFHEKAKLDKYVSNFISRFNKKYFNNNGRKLFVTKAFKDSYFVPNPNEESEEF
jgi:hypothetical protein